MKIVKYGLVFLMLMFLAQSKMALGDELLLKDYEIVVIQEFRVKQDESIPETAGAKITDRVIFQIDSFSKKFNLFEMVIREGNIEVPQGKKAFIIKGEVIGYSEPNVGKRIARNFIPYAGVFMGSASFAAHYQFIDKDTGATIYETDLKTLSTRDYDTVEYAIERNAVALAKLLYRLKVKK